MEDENRFKRLNVRKIASLKNLYNKPISNLEIVVNNENHLDKIEKVLAKKGQTHVVIKIFNNDNKLIFSLKNKRFVDRQNLNILKNQGISTIIF